MVNLNSMSNFKYLCIMYGYSYLRNLDGLPPVASRPVKEFSLPVDKDPAARMMDLIFCVDESTMLPCGSLAQFMSEKTSEEVKKFINDNILHGGESMSNLADVEIQGLPSAVQEKFRSLSGDFIAEISRGRGETMYDYEQRISRYLNDEKVAAEWRRRMSADKKRDKSADEKD